MLGIAASRSMTAMSGRRSRGGAYSEMYSAEASPAGTAKTSAISAIITESGSSAATPNCFSG